MTRPSPKPDEILAEVRQHIADGNYGSACAMFLHLDEALKQHGPLPQDWYGLSIPAPVNLLPDTCQHYWIDNATAKCEACGEEMIGMTLTARTVVSAPNINPCTDPEHLAAMREGREFQCDQPYVPGTPRTVAVGADPTYECKRCEYSGPDGYAVIRADEPVVAPCGQVHRGRLIREGDSFKGVRR